MPGRGGRAEICRRAPVGEALDRSCLWPLCGALALRHRLRPLRARARSVADTAHHQTVLRRRPVRDRDAQPALPPHKGVGLGQFRHASAGLPFRPGRGLYVADSGNARVVLLQDPTLAMVATITTGLSQPLALAVDSLGRIVVADGMTGKLLRFTAGHVEDAGFNVAMAASGVAARFVATGGDDRVYVASTSGAFLHFAADATPLPALAELDANIKAGAIAVQGDRWYAADTATGRILALDRITGATLAAIPDFSGPVTALAACDDGTLLVKTADDANYLPLGAGRLRREWHARRRPAGCRREGCMAFRERRGGRPRTNERTPVALRERRRVDPAGAGRLGRGARAGGPRSQSVPDDRTLSVAQGRARDTVVFRHAASGAGARRDAGRGLSRQTTRDLPQDRRADALSRARARAAAHAVRPLGADHRRPAVAGGDRLLPAGGALVARQLARLRDARRPCERRPARAPASRRVAVRQARHAARRGGVRARLHGRASARHGGVHRAASVAARHRFDARLRYCACAERCLWHDRPGHACAMRYDAAVGLRREGARHDRLGRGRCQRPARQGQRRCAVVHRQCTSLSRGGAGLRSGAPEDDVRDAIRAVVDAEKPAHTVYALCFIEPRCASGCRRSSDSTRW